MLTADHRITLSNPTWSAHRFEKIVRERQRADLRVKFLYMRFALPAADLGGPFQYAGT